MVLEYRSQETLGDTAEQRCSIEVVKCRVEPPILGGDSITLVVQYLLAKLVHTCGKKKAGRENA